MAVEWLRGKRRASCPVCGDDGAKAAVLSADQVIPGEPRVTFLRCAHCGAAFLDNLTAPDYGADTPEMLDYYVEQGAGIDLVVAPLLRVPPSSVKDALEIGCSFPFALDFARFAFGWNILGVDPSPLAVKGSAMMDVPVVHAYFNDDLVLDRESFDLVLCSEILEHVADAHSLLASIRRRLSPDGLLVLSTPNADIVRPDTEEGMLARAMSPGFHLILYTRSALSRMLTATGFTSIEIEESPETLRAFASCSRAAIERLQLPDPAAKHALLRKYLSKRMHETSSVLASGFAYRHFKECVNAGLYEEAAASRDHLARVYRERYGFDFHEPITPSGELPFNLSCAFFFSGILELNALGRADRAAQFFAASIDAGARLRASECPFALYDGETEMLLRQSRKHLPMALASTDPERALREIEQLESMNFPSDLLDEAREQTFVRLVNAGAYAIAQRMKTRITNLIERNPHSLDPLYCLGMLALQTGHPEEAAAFFHRVAESAGVRPDLARLARDHESLSRKRAANEG